MNKYKLNIYISVFFILFGIAIWVAVPYCIRFSDTYSMGNKLLTSYFAPRVLVVILIFNSAVNLLINGILYGKAKKEGISMPHYPVFRWKREHKAFVFALLILIYALILEYVGFIPSSVICGAALLAFMRNKKPLHYLIIISFIIIIYLIFTKVLYVKLP